MMNTPEPIRYWDGIARVLGVSVKTAQRYEKEYGLPVRRKRGPKGAVVYALRHELEAWLSANPGQPKPAAPNRVPHLWRWMAGGAVLAAISLLLALGYLSTKPSLVASWQFDEPGGDRILDRSGQGNHGLITGQLRRVRSPRGQALAFDGKGYVTGAGPGKLFPVANSAFTVSAWLQSSRLSPTGGTIFHFGSAGWDPPRANIVCRLSPRGTVNFGFGYGFQLIEGKSNIADGGWHHVATTYSGGDARRLAIYVDGEEDASAFSADVARLGVATPWAIGVDQRGTTPPYEGLVSDLRLYRRELSHPEIDAVYRCGLAQPDIMLPGNRKGYYLPLYRATISQDPGDPAAPSVPFRYDGFGRGGVEFAASDEACVVESMRGVSVGENVRIAVELKLPPSTEAGPFFRAPLVAPGAPIEGRGHGGYWVRLHSDGAISLHSLNQPETVPNRPLASSHRTGTFDTGRFHALSVEVKGSVLKVTLDGLPVALNDQRELLVPPNGSTEGAAGVGFFVPGQPLHSVLARHTTITLN